MRRTNFGQSDQDDSA